MNKIIQFLRLSRLVLLVILLLFAVAAKIARAETALLWHSIFCPPELQSQVFSSPEAVVKACGFDKQVSYYMGLRDNGNGTYSALRGVVANDPRPDGFATISSFVKTCETKELTNGGRPITDRPDVYDERFANSPTLSKIFSYKAPSGIDAADWYPNRFISCENNCVVSNKRYTSDTLGASTTELDGTSRSWFFKTQTGEICAPENKKSNDPPKPPPPVDDDKPDNGKQPDNGQSGGDTGSNSGDGKGGSDSSSGGPDGGNGTPPDQNSGNDGSGGTQSGGSGGGSGGSQSGGGQIGPGGGGTGGGKNGGNADNGSEGGDDGEGSDNGDGKSDSGNGSGEGSNQSGGDGAITGDKDGKGDGKGDGEGSISGGNCAAEQAPSCKGDPIQCYIAREQWRTACAATGQNSKVEGNGDCKAKRPPECKGDATQCYMVKSRWAEACARAELESYGQGQSSVLEKALGEGGDAEGIIGDNSSTINLPGQLDTAGFGWARTCPISSQIDLGIFGKHDWLADRFCAIANFVGHFLVLLTLIASARYIL